MGKKIVFVILDLLVPIPVVGHILGLGLVVILVVQVIHLIDCVYDGLPMYSGHLWLVAYPFCNLIYKMFERIQ